MSNRETQYTANTGMVTISTANSNLDGTGTLGTVLTAASNGTFIRSLIIKAQTNTTLGMIRFFIDNGSVVNLCMEVEVSAITKSGRDTSFYKVIPFNYSLQSGDVLKVSTQNADTFNIIAEGLDWAYGPFREDSIKYTANFGTATISTANTNLDGTGTIGTILTAGSGGGILKGCMLASIVIKAQVSTSPGMIRLYLQDGENTPILFTEIQIPDVNRSSTTRSLVHEVFKQGNLCIKAGYKVLASTEIAEAFNINIEGFDWEYE